MSRGDDLGFPFKPSESIRVIRERLRQDLQCHVPVKVGISRPIHLPHAAFADLSGDGIRAEGGAGLEWHLVSRDQALEFLEPPLDDHDLGQS